MNKKQRLESMIDHYCAGKPTAFAKYLGVAPSTISSWLSRDTLDYDLIFAKCVEISPNWLLSGVGAMLKTDDANNSIVSSDCRYKEDAIGSAMVSEPTLVNPRKHIKKSDNPTDGIPLITIEAVAGFPTIDEPGRAIADCDRYVVPEFADKGAQFLIRVSGSSMYPKYSSGDILACKKITERLFFQWGKIYVIDSSQGILVKRVFPDNDHLDMIKLVSDNKDNYPPFDIPKSDIRSLSIVVGAIRFE